MLIKYEMRYPSIEKALFQIVIFCYYVVKILYCFAMSALQNQYLTTILHHLRIIVRESYRLRIVFYRLFVLLKSQINFSPTLPIIFILAIELDRLIIRQKRIFIVFKFTKIQLSSLIPIIWLLLIQLNSLIIVFESLLESGKSVVKQLASLKPVIRIFAI